MKVKKKVLQMGIDDYLLKSDTPRKAGGLMSGAASKAVDPIAKLCAKAGTRFPLHVFG
jgi:hypothetical protein